MTSYKTRLLEWGTGVPTTAAHGLTVVVDQGVDVDRPGVVRVRDRATTVFLPDGAVTDDITPREAEVVRYHGSVAEPGDELGVGNDFVLQVQGYAVSEFMSVLGPTLVRVFDEPDLESFLADADRSRESGEFPWFLISPVVHLADQSALGRPPASAGSRLMLRRDGTAAVSATGCTLARWDDDTSGPDLLQAARDTVSHGLEQVLPEDLLRQAVTDRPWLARYLVVTDALRHLQRRGLETVQVSGFGDTLSGRPHSRHDAHLPVLVSDDQNVHLFDPPTGRIFRMDRTTGSVLDLLLFTEGVDDLRRTRPELVERARAVLRSADLELPSTEAATARGAA